MAISYTLLRDRPGLRITFESGNIIVVAQKIVFQIRGGALFCFPQ
jgi:hypothetical protein